MPKKLQCKLKCERWKYQHECLHTGAPPLEKPAPFAIQAHDRTACAVIRAWIMAAGSIGTNAKKLMKAEQHLRDFRLWQRENVTKVPD